MRKFIWMLGLAYLLTGFGHIIIGSVLEPMLQHYQLDYRDGGQLIMNQFFGFLVGVLFAPKIIKALGRRNTLLLSLFLFAFSQLSLGLLLHWEWLLFIIPLGGAGIGLIETTLAGLIIGKLKEKKASIMVLTEALFGVGALTVPIFAAIFIATGSWNHVFILISVIVSSTLLLWAFIRFPEYEFLLIRERKSMNEPKKDGAARFPKMTYPMVFLGSFFFFLYVGVEMTFPNYLPSILGMMSNLSDSVLALSITVFWGAMTIGRIIMIFIIDRVGFPRLFFITTLGQTVTLGLFALSPHYIISFLVIFVAGLLMGGIFSLGLLVVNEGIPGLEDRTTSLMIAMGGLGGALLPRLFGEMLDRYSVHLTLWTIFSLAIVMFILTVMIFMYRKRLLHSQIHYHK
ncbi:MFS transporter [Alkalihalobacillus trypoxylicola]|uniref:Major facilitator superfamily (MFS) profile domain-containing protein n=1 Tax=Alkalihalobacillus trypoxylicola TaxID=519424 RepID=A0A162CMZ5_9BACI|nr:MFS transporter [Alkalihalobacillus trypoxylicola]KYG25610.1 hypothetical protein AZF04_14075 [Alkalihalobacillus trypoxylicola]